MKTYTVKITPDTKADLRRYLKYLRDNKRNPQAAASVADDFKETTEKLKTIAGSIVEPESERLRERGLRRINFQRHNYFLLYRVVDDVAEVTDMFHGYEDYENKLT